MPSDENNRLSISSPVFDNEGTIPSRYTCDGDNINPPLVIDGIPEGTESLAIIVEDPDAPKGTFDHWLAWNIPPSPSIPEHSNPGINGHNSAGKTGYHGPCPPSGTHRYYFYLFALDTSLDRPAGAGKQQLKSAMGGHLLAEGQLMGRYAKTSGGQGAAENA